ncbi:MAG: hypothetical protein ACLR56_07645 [Oscillospiraceae bacterium]
MVPIDMRSSILAAAESNLRAMYTTSRRLCTISLLRFSCRPHQSPNIRRADGGGVFRPVYVNEGFTIPNLISHFIINALIFFSRPST